MKKLLFISYLFLFVCNRAMPQSYLPEAPFKPWTFKGIIPNYYQVFSDSASISSQSDGFNCLDTDAGVMAIVDGDFLYVLLIYTYFGDHEGGYLTKVDLKTGKQVWKSVYNLKNTDKQEIPAHFFINDVGNVEITSYKRIAQKYSDPWFPFSLVDKNCSFSRRIYNQSDGKLVEYFAPLLDYSIAYGIYSEGDAYSYLKRKKDGDYFYVRNFYQIGTDYNVLYYNIDGKDFSLKSLDTIRSSDNTNRFNIIKDVAIEYIDKGEYFITKPFYGDSKTRIYKTNLRGKILDSIFLENDKENNYNRFIRRIKEDKILFVGTNIDTFSHYTDNIIFYDIGGNKINELIDKFDNQKGYGYYSFGDSNNSKDLFFGFSSASVYKSSSGSIDIYEKAINEDKLLKFSLSFNDSLKYGAPILHTSFNDNTIFMFRELAVYLDKKSSKYKNDFDAQAISIASFKTKDLNLSTAAIEIVQPMNLHISPNPCKSGFEIKSQSPLDKVAVYNETGQLVRQISVAKGDVYIDLNSNANGLYIIKATDVSGTVIVGKVVKIE
jgi:hypothetical protein